MAEDLDPRYSPQPSLQEGFIDKNTGLPLSFGLIYSYANQSRTTLKPIYTLQEAVPGGPVNYVPLPNPIVLSGVGTIQDANGNDVIPYFFPFDSNGNIELYYIRATDQFGTAQFTREAFPNITPSTIGEEEVTNFIPNGQFLIHNTPGINMPQLANFNYGTATTLVRAVAPGGWTYELSSTSTAFNTDFITFVRNTQFVQPTDESSSPRYLVHITRTVASADLICDLRIKFMDVFKFASNTQEYTFLFTANTVSSILNNVQVLAINYYGSGGSATTENFSSDSPINLNTTPTVYSFRFTFTPDTTASIGVNDDDFMQIAVRFPTGSGTVFDVELTDFMLVPGTVDNTTEFPVTTNGNFLLQALANVGPTTRGITPTGGTQPSYYSEDGSNLYLPIIMTSEGMTYDYGVVGRIESYSQLAGFTSSSISAITNLLLCDGAAYKTGNYSPLGIPYSRLHSTIWDNVNNAPIYGTGANFATAYINSAAPDQLYIDTNKPGNESVPVDGSTPTGFGFLSPSLIPGQVTIGYKANVNAANKVVTAIANFTTGTLGGAGVADGAGPLATGMPLSDLKQPNTNTILPTYYYSFLVTASSAAALANPGNPGKYFSFSSNTTNFYMWFFTINESDPAPVPGWVGIKAHLISSMTALEVANIIAQALSGNQVDLITTNAGATINHSSFFTFFTNSGAVNHVFYIVNGVGVGPAAGNNIGVNITGLETAAQIATKTQIAINSSQFATPDLRGIFLRGVDPTGLVDLDTGIRYMFVNTVSGNPYYVGSMELDALQSHWHPPSSAQFFLSSGGGSISGAGTGTTSGATGPIGERETRPINMAVNYTIRY